jgi:hypothetical protein
MEREASREFGRKRKHTVPEATSIPDQIPTGLPEAAQEVVRFAETPPP